MGVKIKYMELPKKCIECPLFVLNEYGYRFCLASPSLDIKYYQAIYQRHDDCPMEE